MRSRCDYLPRFAVFCLNLAFLTNRYLILSCGQIQNCFKSASILHFKYSKCLSLSLLVRKVNQSIFNSVPSTWPLFLLPISIADSRGRDLRALRNISSASLPSLVKFDISIPIILCGLFCGLSIPCVRVFLVGLLATLP